MYWVTYKHQIGYDRPKSGRADEVDLVAVGSLLLGEEPEAVGVPVVLRHTSTSACFPER